VPIGNEQKNIRGLLNGQFASGNPATALRTNW